MASYYAWFLDQIDSSCLLEEGQTVYRECLKQAEFTKNFKPYLYGDEEDLNSYYTRQHFRSASEVLHCTALYSNHGKAPGAEAYENSFAVEKELGKTSTLTIFGFVLTPRSFGARVLLSDDQLKLWPEIQETRNSPIMKRVPHNDVSANDTNVGAGGSSIQSGAPDGNLEGEPNSCNSTHGNLFGNLAKRFTQLQIAAKKAKAKVKTREKYIQTPARGRRAHLTIGCAYDVKPVETGRDLIHVQDIEAKSGCQWSKNIEIGRLRYFGEGQYLLDLKQVKQFDCVFSGYYK